MIIKYKSNQLTEAKDTAEFNTDAQAQEAAQKTPEAKRDIESVKNAIKNGEQQEEKRKKELDPKKMNLEVHDGSKSGRKKVEEYDWIGKMEDARHQEILHNLDVAEGKVVSESLSDALDAIARSNIMTEDMQRMASSFSRQRLNMLISGEPGSGKTSIVKDWAKTRGLSYLLLTGAQLTNIMVRGIPVESSNIKRKKKKYTKTEIETAANALANNEDISDEEEDCLKNTFSFLRSTIFNPLMKCKTDHVILIVDEINRAELGTEAALLTLIQDGLIPVDDEEGSELVFDKFLFTVAIQNPNDSAGADLSQAMQSRFIHFQWDSDPKRTYEYLMDKYRALGEDIQFSGNERSSIYLPIVSGWYNIVDALNKHNVMFTMTEDEINNYNDTHQEIASRYSAEKGVSSAIDTETGEIFALNSRMLTTCLEACNGRAGYEILNKDGTGTGIYQLHSFLYYFQKCCPPIKLDVVSEALQGISNEEREEDLQYLKRIGKDPETQLIQNDGEEKMEVTSPIGCYGLWKATTKARQIAEQLGIKLD